MKTTIELNDALLRKTKRLAVKRNTSMKALIEAALRQYLDTSTTGQTDKFRLRKHPFRGQGLQAGQDDYGWPAIREQIYRGRGG